MINNKKIKIYFVGIGGIGMSGIAELMHEIGYTVFGSDKIESDNVKRLKKIGINVKIGHDKKNLRKVSAVVFSSAISPKNPEIKEAKKIGSWTLKFFINDLLTSSMIRSDIPCPRQSKQITEYPLSINS